MILPRTATIIRTPQTPEHEVILFKTGFTKMWSCICARCGVENIEDNFNDAIIGKGKTVKDTWHRPDCVFITARVNTMFDANEVYVKY